MNEGIPPKRYYTDQGRSHDFVLRCADCQSLTLYSHLVENEGCMKCGNKRFKEVEGLTFLEWVRIKLGLLKFTDSDKFLEEFKRGQ